MKIELNALDNISKMENKIESLISKHDLSKTKISFENYDEQVIYILTILTILYKERLYNISLQEKTKNTELFLDYSTTNNTIYGFISVLYACLKEKDIELASELIKQNGEEIKIFLQRYYARKNQNYILKKEPMNLIIEHKKQEELFQINPYIINKYLLYNQNPMTKKEKIFCDIIEYRCIASLNEIKGQGEVLNCIKELMKHNYDDQTLERAILFIVGTVYQEVLEQEISEISFELRRLIENPKIENKQIIDYFKLNNNFSKRVLTLLLMTIINIGEGKIRELENRKSYTLVKRRIENKPLI